jgi:hypothetical protein
MPACGLVTRDAKDVGISRKMGSQVWIPLGAWQHLGLEDTLWWYFCNVWAEFITSEFVLNQKEPKDLIHLTHSTPTKLPSHYPLSSKTNKSIKGKQYIVRKYERRKDLVSMNIPPPALKTFWVEPQQMKLITARAAKRKIRFPSIKRCNYRF